MKTHLNTLFVTLEGAWLSKDGAAIAIRHKGKTKLRVPFHNLDGIVCFGWDTCASAALMAACSENNVSLSFHSPYGKFLASVRGFTPGNIVLRREQYRRADDPLATLNIAKNCISAKLSNCRTVVQRALRDHPSPESSSSLKTTANYLGNRIQVIRKCDDIDKLRGIEGEAAIAYFAAFPKLVTTGETTFLFRKRSRRPPLDPINALLSFIYSLLTHDIRSACESCGLDPQCGFLHRDRPGRPSLALDLIEEFRPMLADRLALSLINRKQLQAKNFEHKESGAVYLKDKSRKIVLQAWQERKQGEIMHPFLQEKTTIGLLVHLQARLLARHLRGDLDAYPAFLWK